MTKPIKLSSKEWEIIRKILHKKFPPSYFIREKMKEKLGFTVREHSDWIPNKDYEKQYAAYEEAKNNGDDMNYILTLPPDRGTRIREIHLDFYDEKKRTMFLLTYIGVKE